ncbi:hypothetical protein CI610_02034 [invertebrate metagenome]|uniref:Gamma-glutamylcyclotransferase AIG2-like domain-containing protein n=1 Tax=invertebrate metagenome TaxID=1711999 RepID=A0A2H9T6Z4_9ZZZZ
MTCHRSCCLTGFLFSLCLLLGCEQSPEVSRYPKIDEQVPQYIIGFGNLMYSYSRDRILSKSKFILPVLVYGYQRSWVARSRPDGVSMTRLGVVPTKEKFFNGLLVALPVSSLKKLDLSSQSEVSRVLVDRGSLKSLLIGQKIPETGQFWMYQVRETYRKPPARGYPIMQSRVDEFLSGCLDVSDRFKLTDFKYQCLQTTNNWSEHWGNDRRRPLKEPVYRDIYYKKVDDLLERLGNNFYEKVRED